MTSWGPTHTPADRTRRLFCEGSCDGWGDEGGTFILRSLIRAATIVAAVVFASLQPLAASAEGHLPVITFSPVATWSSGIDTRGNATNPAIEGPIELTGSVTVPIYKGLSGTYDRVAGGLIYSTFSGVSIGGAPFQAGSVRDFVDQFRLDGVINKSLTVETGLRFRHRLRGGGASNDNSQPFSTEYHAGYLGFTYTTPSFKALHNALLVLNVTGLTANHNPSPNALASYPKGLDVGNKREYGASEAATLVVPVDPKSGLTATATYLHGQLEYWEDFPFPFAYNVTVFNLIKNVNPYLGVEVGAGDVWQQRQGNPFPLPSVIHVATFTTQLDFHFDFNKLLGKPKAAAPGSV